MEEKKIACSLITPLFSYGAYQGMPELRTPELKGAMRYLYRIACPVRTNILAKDEADLAKGEAELFGGPSDSQQKPGHASPVQLSMRGHVNIGKRNLLSHDKRRQQPQECFTDGKFEIILRCHQTLIGDVPPLSRKVDIDWYSDVIKLSLILCGMGRRSRKGKSRKQSRDAISSVCPFPQKSEKSLTQQML